MTIILPILFAAVLVGLFAPRLNDRRLLVGLGIWFAVIIAVAYFKS